MRVANKTLLLLFTVTVFMACHPQKKSMIGADESRLIHKNEDLVTQMIIYDVFTPPVASRIYSYTSLASYEALRFQNSKYPSITAQLKGFDAIPQPEKNEKYSFSLAASKALFTVLRHVTFSVDSLKAYEDKLYGNYKSDLDAATYERSIAFGTQVAKVILKRASMDGYDKSRGKPKYQGSNEDGKWHPTPPDYLDGVEWCWNTMQTFSLDSAAQFSLPPPPAFSKDKKSEYFKQNLTVYNQSKSQTAKEREIATYWDDNPFVTVHSGHLMFANKKITPAGHWIGITRIACEKSKADAVKSAQAYTMVSVGMFDTFISCWDTKYKTKYIRPISVINSDLDPNWVPILQTPPFPEYPSGHSSITRAAAVVLTRLFGDNFSFEDDSDFKYIGMKRKFKSFIQASDEASISRFYGGIHYKNSVDMGASQGNQVGNFILSKIKL
ncbi:hypothetical protein ACVWYG_001865 [Pedobacter sp. UYEF25]